VQRRNLRLQEIPASFRSLHSLRSARLTRSGGFEPERRRSQVTILFSRDGFKTRHNRLFGPQGARYAMAGERFGAAPGLQRQIRRRFAAHVFRRADA
jgi:hypothetical protein